jgi:hypothetical protein
MPPMEKVPLGPRAVDITFELTWPGLRKRSSGSRGPAGGISSQAMACRGPIPNNILSGSYAHDAINKTCSDFVGVFPLFSMIGLNHAYPVDTQAYNW